MKRSEMFGTCCQYLGAIKLNLLDLATLETPFQMETDRFPSAFELPLKWLITMVSLLKQSLTSIACMWTCAYSAVFRTTNFKWRRLINTNIWWNQAYMRLCCKEYVCKESLRDMFHVMRLFLCFVNNLEI